MLPSSSFLALHLVTILSISLLAACGSNKNTNQTVTTNQDVTITTATRSLGITALPAALKATYSQYMTRYTKVDAPNGKPIHIFAQDKITDEQIVRVRGILQHYLTNLAGSSYGADKSAIANKMADNGARLLLLNGTDDGTNLAQKNLKIKAGQPLFQTEIQVEGHSWYINQNYTHRDASYEEILHLVHDFGIGVDKQQNGTFRGVLLEYQKEIRAAQQKAYSHNPKIWSPSSGIYNEWLKENSLSQEYLAAVIDTYYGLWGADTATRGMGGVYAAKIRDDIVTKDSTTVLQLVKKFFHPYLNYNARIDKGFNGTFTLSFDSNKSYSHHSRYLKDITFLGSNNNNVIVNQYDNFLTGNSGTNAAVFHGNISDYDIVRASTFVTVKDKRSTSSIGFDGKNNTLGGFERLMFKDTSTATHLP